MNAILFAVAFGGVLAAAVAGPGDQLPSEFAYGPDYALNDTRDDAFMARTEIDGWTVDIIGGAD